MNRLVFMSVNDHGGRGVVAGLVEVCTPNNVWFALAHRASLCLPINTHTGIHTDPQIHRHTHTKTNTDTATHTHAHTRARGKRAIRLRAIGAGELVWQGWVVPRWFQ